MLVFELRWFLTLVVALLIITVFLSVALDRRLRRIAPASHDLALLGSGFEFAPIGLLVLNSAGDCVYANRFARRTLELPAPPCSLPRTDWAELLRADNAGARLESNAAGRFRSVSLPLDQSAQWWLTPFGELSVVVLHGTTDAQRAEEVTRASLSDLSHELRTPLATLLTHLEILQLPRVSPETRAQSVQLMQTEARRMARLLNDLLALTRLESSVALDWRVVELVALVLELRAQVESQAQARQIRLDIQAEMPLALVMGDAGQLKQVFLNLLDNAVKYARSGGLVRVSLARGDDAVVCAVSDNGPGIAPEHLPLLTRRFYRANVRGVEGSGLGLALVDVILRRHHSRLEIDSQTSGPQMGTCMHFTLPLAGKGQGA